MNNHLAAEQAFRQQDHSAEGDAMIRARNIANRKLYQGGMQSLSEVIIGEERAKVMLLALGAMGAQNGTAGIAIGPPGGGKSMLMEQGYRVFGIDPSRVARVPHREDLSASELIGKSTKMTKTTRQPNGDEVVENISSEISPIINGETQFVAFDEISRTSPLALNAAFKIMQDGGLEIVNSKGEIISSEFTFVLSSMNNHGTLFTHSLDPGIGARHAMGVIMGHREKGKLSEAGIKIWEDDPEIEDTKEIKKVIEADELVIVRNAINYVHMAAEERSLGMELTIGMLDELENNGITIADPRTGLQLKRVARTLALLSGAKAVNENHIREAVDYGMTARLGALTRMTKAEIDSSIAEVLNGS